MPDAPGPFGHRAVPGWTGSSWRPRDRTGSTVRSTPRPAGEGWCQRWRYGAHSWRHRHEGGFHADRYITVDLDETPAREFVSAHHYLAGWPACKLRYGMLDMATGSSGQLVGVAVLGIPVRAD
jgi:hypothetical protein